MTTGLRERKKQQTRELISNVATELFIARGFERTTIADVAAAAEVAKMTVTNYFPLKEDLVFDRAEEIAAMPAEAVAGRQAGTGAFQSVRDHHLRAMTVRSAVGGTTGLRFARLVVASPALLAREREMFGEQEDRLAAVLQAEFASSAGDLRPRLAATQLSGIVRICYYEARRRLFAEESAETIVAALRRSARAAYATIEPTLPASYTRS